MASVAREGEGGSLVAATNYGGYKVELVVQSREVAQSGY